MDGLDIKLYSGRAFVLEEMEGLKFKISPKSFYQTNSQQAYNLYKITREFAGLTGNDWFTIYIPEQAPLLISWRVIVKKLLV
jgi:tRNA/tmRNA/rRNA uracil-C5-methylase (TrmA/RlmC/RlmD family)